MVLHSGSTVDATSRPRVKICCIASEHEARLAIRYGAAALGLVSAIPSGPGVIPDEQIAAIASIVPPGVATFLLTSRQGVPGIVEQQRRLGVNTIQLCDRVDEGSYADLRASLPGIGLVQVIHVTGPEAVDQAVAAASSVDALLLDSGNPSLARKELGGTGRVHDWEISRRIRELVEVPVYLAGGLTPENVAQAIAQVGPFAVDVCGGVRTNRNLDEAKLAAFVAGVAR